MSDVAHDKVGDSLTRFRPTTTQLAEWTVAAVAIGVGVTIAGDISLATKVFVTTIGLAALTVWIVVQDSKSFTIADGAVVSIACLALSLRLAEGDTLLAIGSDVLVIGGPLLAFREIYYRRKGFDGLGLGDVKLAAAGGLLLGADAFACALLGASLLALGVVAIKNSLARRNRVDVPWNGASRVAFGAFLAPAIWLSWVVQHLSLLSPSSVA